MEYEVYKKIRKKAIVFGMPSNNFWIMIVFDVLVFLIALGGFTLLKIGFILLCWAVAYILARFVLNADRLGVSKIEDYRRR